MNTTLSIVIPCYNEAENLDLLYGRICTACAKIDFELIFVNDGSTDQTAQFLSALQQNDARIQVVSLTHNFGVQAALRAGLRSTRGMYVVTMDADLQHPPESIPAMIEAASNGTDIIIMVRDIPQPGFLKELFSRLFFKTFYLCSGIHIEPRASDFRLVSRRVAQVVNLLPERVAFFRALLLQLGFTYTYMTYKLSPRHGGKSAYSISARCRLAAQALVAFSSRPFRYSFFLVSTVAVIALIYGVFDILFKVAHGAGFGITDMVAPVVFLGGLNFVILGIIAKYLQIIPGHLNKRPEYIIDETNHNAPSHNC